MALSIEIHNTGASVGRTELTSAIEHVLSDRAGDWRVSIIGSQGNDQWEMSIHGPNGFERRYMLDGSAGEHQPPVVQALLRRMLPANSVC